jgi:hypothetical protein
VIIVCTAAEDKILMRIGSLAVHGLLARRVAEVSARVADPPYQSLQLKILCRDKISTAVRKAGQQ